MVLVAYFNKKTKIISGGRNVKIYNHRNVVDVRPAVSSKTTKVSNVVNAGDIASTSPWLHRDPMMSVDPNAFGRDYRVSQGGISFKDYLNTRSLYPFTQIPPNSTTRKVGEIIRKTTPPSPTPPAGNPDKPPSGQPDGSNWWSDLWNKLNNPVNITNIFDSPAVPTVDPNGSSGGGVLGDIGEQLDNTRNTINLALIVGGVLAVIWFLKK
jgi:hypothetical protein